MHINVCLPGIICDTQNHGQLVSVILKNLDRFTAHRVLLIATHPETFGKKQLARRSREGNLTSSGALQVAVQKVLEGIRGFIRAPCAENARLLSSLHLEEKVLNREHLAFARVMKMRSAIRSECLQSPQSSF
jgi:hypothetical protein